MQVHGIVYKILASKIASTPSYIKCSHIRDKLKEGKDQRVSKISKYLKCSHVFVTGWLQKVRMRLEWSVAKKVWPLSLPACVGGFNDRLYITP